MPFTPIEWIAAIVVILSLIKIIFIIFNKKKYFELVSPIYTKSKGTSWILLLLALVVLYFLLQSLSIVTIMAVMAFTSLLIGFAFMQYPKQIMSLAKKIYSKQLSFAMTIYILIWLLLSLWTLKELFF